MAGVARLSDHLAGAAANWAGARNREEALLEAHLAAPAALLARAGRFAVRGAGAATLAANIHTLDGDGRLLAEDRLFEFDRQVVTDIAATLRTRSTPAAASAGSVEHLSEEIAEDVAQIDAARKATCSARAAHARNAIAVVCRTLFGIAQHLVGLARLLKALLRLRIVRVTVWVILHRQLAICSLQFPIAAFS